MMNGLSKGKNRMTERSKHVLARKIRQCIALLNELLEKAKNLGIWVSISKSSEDGKYQVNHIVEHETREY